MPRFELAKPSADTRSFVERLSLVWTTAVGYEQGRYRVPAVGTQEAGRAVVASHNHDSWIECHNFGNAGIQFLDSIHLGVEITVFTCAVGVFEVHEKEIEIVPGLLQCGDLLVQRLRLSHDFHPYQPG